MNDLREAWLNPADLVRIEPEVVAGYPDRVLPVSDEAAKVLKTRTLTNLYNQRPPGWTWPTGGWMRPSPPPTAGPPT